MTNVIPPIIGALIFVTIIRILLKRGDNGYDKAVDKFLERENNANSITKDFDTLNLNFIEPSKNLPFKQYENISMHKSVIKKQNLVKRRCELKMIKIPTNLTNTELKEIYGVNNFEQIFLLEEHFNSYVRGLYEWAKELYNLNSIYDCKKVLLEAVRLEANISQVYILLVKIYSKENDKTSILNLKSTVQNIDLSLKDKVLQEIEKYL